MQKLFKDPVILILCTIIGFCLANGILSLWIDWNVYILVSFDHTSSMALNIAILISSVAALFTYVWKNAEDEHVE